MEEAVLEALGKKEYVKEDSDVRQGKYMTFRVGQDVFGIELRYVNEILQMQPITPIPEVEHFINLQQEMVFQLLLHHLLIRLSHSIKQTLNL